MEAKNKFNIVLLISTIFSILSSLIYLFVGYIFLAMGSNSVSDFTLWYEYFFLFVFLILGFLFVFYPVIKVYLLVQYHYNDKFYPNLSLIIIILSLLNIPFGTILGVFMLIFRNDVLEDLNKSSNKKKKVVSKKK